MFAKCTVWLWLFDVAFAIWSLQEPTYSTILFRCNGFRVSLSLCECCSRCYIRVIYHSVHFVIKFIHLLLNNGICTGWCVHLEVGFGFCESHALQLFATKLAKPKMQSSFNLMRWDADWMFIVEIISFPFVWCLFSFVKICSIHLLWLKVQAAVPESTDSNY